MTTPQPSPPSDEERRLYYYGLPSMPKLVARSSPEVWEKPVYYGFWSGIHPKSLFPVGGGNSPLQRLWNDRASSLRTQIMEAVRTLDWTAVDIFRVVLCDQKPITLLVSVKPDSVSWERGLEVALRCKAILEEHSIPDVHCEIRESLVLFCADPPSSNLELSEAPATINAGNHGPALSDYIGTAISTTLAPDRAGTKGLYLALSPSSGDENEPKIVALSCRHVLLDPAKEGLEEYRRPQDGPLKEVIQADQPTVEHLLKTLPGTEQVFRGSKTEDLSALADATASFLQCVQRCAKPSERVFGQVLYAPAFEVASSLVGAPWLRDWALIELRPRNHEASLSSLKNKVYVKDVEEYVHHLINVFAGLAGPARPTDVPVTDRALVLQQVFPLQEMLNPKWVSNDTDETVVAVAQRGERGGLCFGHANSLKSVVRHILTHNGNQVFESEEWAITAFNISDNRQAAFSKTGDSGSCVWDLAKSRPAGMIGAGNGGIINGHEGGSVFDITYAHPMEQLLEDIRSHGFDVSLV